MKQKKTTADVEPMSPEELEKDFRISLRLFMTPSRIDSTKFLWKFRKRSYRKFR